MRFDEERFEIVLDGNGSKKDYLLLSDGEFLLRELKPGAGSGKGKNSCVFRAEHPEGGANVIVKFCCYPKGVQGDEEVRRRQRFKREVAALQKATEAGLGNFLITLYESGTAQVGGFHFNYYVMEEADCDLADYLAENRLTLQQKLLLCRSLLRDVAALHGLGIYHRDLKPDNVFFIGNQWKIGDLGFIKHWDDDASIDGDRERIGPTGLMAPEALNKAFAIRENAEFDHESEFCPLSDVYLLGGVFWYVFQGNLPGGQLEAEDFRAGRTDIFEKLLKPMLQHSKARRADVDSVNMEFDSLKSEFAL